MNCFTEHPHAVGETYFEHMAMAARFGCRLLAAGLACLIHAVFPFLCITTASQNVHALYEQMSRRQAMTARGIDVRGMANSELG